MHNKRTTELRLQDANYLQQATQAAASSDLERLIKILTEARIIESIFNWVRRKWPTLTQDEVDLSVAEAVSAFYKDVSHGQRVLSPMSYFFKVADRKASIFHRGRELEEHLEPKDFNRKAEQASYKVGISRLYFNSDDDIESEKRRLKAISIAKSLVNEMRHETAQAVMVFILEALESGVSDISNKEIADALGISVGLVSTCKTRGFQRLSRMVVERGLADEDIDFVSLMNDVKD